MGSSSLTSPCRVLWIAATDNERDPSIVARIEQASGTINRCPDVYRALARVDRLRPVAVVLSVDWLGESQFEFLRIMRHRRRELPVFVLGTDRSRSMIGRAIEAGATGVLTDEALAMCLADFHQTALEAGVMPPETSVRPPAEDRPGKKSDTFAQAGNVFDTDTGCPSAEAEVQHETDRETTQRPKNARQKRRIRVPWLEYSEGPRRVPPKHGTPTGPQPQHGDPGKQDAPLLSPEELEALLGDDGASAACGDE